MHAVAEWVSKNRLVTILLVAYLFLSAISFEQGRIIDSQRNLIQQLFGDSMQLNHIRWQKAIGNTQNH